MYPANDEFRRRRHRADSGTNEAIVLNPLDNRGQSIVSVGWRAIGEVKAC
jgi:hypothetical protein